MACPLDSKKSKNWRRTSLALTPPLTAEDPGLELMARDARPGVGSVGPRVRLGMGSEALEAAFAGSSSAAW
jgi:hypothetical protein